jgi:hypothetical protein
LSNHILVTARGLSVLIDLKQALLRVLQIDQSIVAAPTHIAGLSFFRKPSNPTTEQVCWTDLGLHLKPKAQNHMHCYTSRVTYVIELFGSDRGRSIAQPRIFPETASFSIPSFSSTQRNKTNLSLTYRMPHQKQESPALGNTPQSALLHIVFMQNTLQSLTSQAICTKAQHSYCCEV